VRILLYNHQSSTTLSSVAAPPGNLALAAIGTFAALRPLRHGHNKLPVDVPRHGHRRAARLGQTGPPPVDVHVVVAAAPGARLHHHLDDAGVDPHGAHPHDAGAARAGRDEVEGVGAFEHGDVGVRRERQLEHLAVHVRKPPEVLLAAAGSSGRCCWVGPHEQVKPLFFLSLLSVPFVSFALFGLNK
jgi:hypothetical protein